MTMYRPAGQPGGGGQGQTPPATFAQASQSHRQQNAATNRSRAVPILAPSQDFKAALVRQSNGTSGSASPSKAALSAKAASAAVFIPKGAPSTRSQASAEGTTEGMEDHGSPAGMMQHMSLRPAGNANSESSHLSSQFAPFSNTDSGRATPNMPADYDTDGSNNLFDPTYMGPLPPSQQDQHAHDGQAGGNAVGGHASNTAHQSNATGKAYNPYEHLNEYGEPIAPSGAMGMPNAGMEFYTEPSTHSSSAVPIKLRQPLQYHLYTPPMPHVSNLHPQHLTANAFFMNEDEREQLQRMNEALHAGVPPPELGGPVLPEELHVYHSLVPLEPSPLAGMPGNSMVPQLIDPRLVPPTAPATVNHLTGACGEASRVFGYRCHVYKAQCTLDGKCYVLRRLENFRLNHEAAIGLVERWRRIRHPSIVSVREAFTTRAFGDSSIVFVYDYHPLASTLYAEHMMPKPPQPDRRTGRMQTKPMQVHEQTLWSYLCQLTNIVHTIHHHGLAARCIEPSKVLRTAKNRIRLNCCSVFDVIAYDPNASQSTLQAHQAEDLVNVGRLMLALACNSPVASQNMQRSVEQLTRYYSVEFKSVVLWLLAPKGQSVPMPSLNGVKVGVPEGHDDAERSADTLQRILGVKYADEFDSALNHSDLLESHLFKELENARLVRLLCKFGFINERPEFDHDSRWSETGDRYIVKLFRDHVFHAVDPAGRPVVDLSHILTNLNKLDAGSLEKIMLTSRDEQSCLVVSYREIKTCVDAAFADLSRAR